MCQLVDVKINNDNDDFVRAMNEKKKKMLEWKKKLNVTLFKNYEFVLIICTQILSEKQNLSRIHKNYR